MNKEGYSVKAVAQSTAVLLAVAYIAVSLTFGGSPNPPLWCLFSEMVTDLANEIANCSDYKSKVLASPSQPKLTAPKLLSSTALLTKALPLAMTIPVMHTKAYRKSRQIH